MPHTNKDQGGVEETHNTREGIEALVIQLRTVANMINMGEKIRWAQETTLMDQAADLLETHHQELQKAREEERERSQVEVLAAITGLQEALDNAPMTFNQDIDITEVPDGLAHELRGMKKGWHAALEQLKANLNV